MENRAITEANPYQDGNRVAIHASHFGAEYLKKAFPKAWYMPGALNYGIIKGADTTDPTKVIVAFPADDGDAHDEDDEEYPVAKDELFVFQPGAPINSLFKVEISLFKFIL